MRLSGRLKIKLLRNNGEIILSGPAIVELPGAGQSKLVQISYRSAPVCMDGLQASPSMAQIRGAHAPR